MYKFRMYKCRMKKVRVERLDGCGNILLLFDFTNLEFLMTQLTVPQTHNLISLPIIISNLLLFAACRW